MVTYIKPSPNRYPLRMMFVSFLAGLLVCVWFAQFDSPIHQSPDVKAACIDNSVQSFDEPRFDDFEFDNWATKSNSSIDGKPASFSTGKPVSRIDPTANGQTLVGLQIRLQI